MRQRDGAHPPAHRIGHQEAHVAQTRLVGKVRIGVDRAGDQAIDVGNPQTGVIQCVAQDFDAKLLRP
jgi:hypothetical protein